MKLTASEIGLAVDGQLVGKDVHVNGATQDSREVGKGQLFVAVRGEVDGHAFIEQAVKAGATAYLTDGIVVKGATAIVVPDTMAALIALGKLARKRLPDNVTGITGSVGKTSVKDLLAAILGRIENVAASRKSFNNEIGCPLTLINAPDDVDSVVVEMGARKVGNIEQLCEIARPTIGVVTNVGLAHIGTLGGIEETARTKGELIESLPNRGTAVLNYADERVLAMRRLTNARILTFGINAGDVQARDIKVDDQLRASFRLHTSNENAQVHLNVRGEHQVMNAIAAATAAIAANVDLQDVVEGLEAAALSPWRMELLRTKSGATILNDAYNANPVSVRAALNALKRLPATGRRVAVLGVMAELGDISPGQHESIAEYAEGLDIEVLAVAAPEYKRQSVESIGDAVKKLGPLLPGDAVLIKGSRVAELEKLAKLLLD